MNCISKRGTSLGDKNCIELCDRSHLYYKSIINYDLDITNNLIVSPQIRYIEVFDITNPRFNEQIWPVPSDFVKSRFHCMSSFLCEKLATSSPIYSLQSSHRGRLQAWHLSMHGK